MRIVVVNHVSLDGVLQSPARPDEDSRDGFRHGGWAGDNNDPRMGEAIGERLGQNFSWLFGHRSYDDMLGHWNEVGGPFKEGLNGPTKYVVSSNPNTDLPWPNSTLITGDIPYEIGALRKREGGNLVIMGSGQLIRSLLPHGLIDELFLMIHPIVLSSGHRIFPSGDSLQRFKLINSEPTESGVLMITYQA